ncbi:tRNA (adenosine(37)-N6)-threonylcarbamoyltransferase complex transferase subunit TsaD [Robiginitomaculum antarcticum]|uniref:tRNA (adenosine(37)-N6)-threonylcarbamoyltransferase complex transferase subunit TsaD n=1 Tax=Robiginitomaculum antarcticum TaxID=437507 RepID=UPI000375FD40|nr:tRNA (adenosine(37)-N6)-threonylcarbamoyltransferase complex transferase subunit TsaD [Robiginitomaculum antarcticum]
MDIAFEHSARQDANPDITAHTVLVLGIESSCDETAASVIRLPRGGAPEILSSRISSQDELHRPYGGVVPEMAARAHMDKIQSIIAGAVEDAGINYTDLDGIAATSGPGLIGGVITGLMAAKGLALSLDKPLIAVNHLEGHALSARLSAPCPFPYLLLLVSGGHTQLLSVNDLGDYSRLGSTVDDAAGEAFDKTAKIMGLGFPGGPNVERAAKAGNAKRFKLPRPFAGTDHADFSFAGLKTAAARTFASMDNPDDQDKADLAASFQTAVCGALTDRTQRAMMMFRKRHGDGPQRLVVAGGVAANVQIRAALDTVCTENDFVLMCPPLKFCTDNAAMIALAGAEKLLAGEIDNLDAPARPRWPLDETAARRNPASGSGRKGPKS